MLPPTITFLNQYLYFNSEEFKSNKSNNCKCNELPSQRNHILKFGQWVTLTFKKQFRGHISNHRKSLWNFFHIFPEVIFFNSSFHDIKVSQLHFSNFICNSVPCKLLTPKFLSFLHIQSHAHTRTALWNFYLLILIYVFPVINNNNIEKLLLILLNFHFLYPCLLFKHSNILIIYFLFFSLFLS